MEKQAPLSLLSQNKKYFILIGLLLGLTVVSLSVFMPLCGKAPYLKSLESSMSPKLLDRYGYPIQVPLNVNGERTLFLDLEEIPSSLRQAFLLSEDKNFYSHRGVDVRALFRAFYQSLKERRIVSGASTITMQLVKIYWPELSHPQNKLAQMIQALRLESHYKKNEILVHYLNLIPFAYQVSGLGQACFYFYNKSCDRLSLAEEATLAVLPRNPNFYTKNKDHLLRARNRVLKKTILNPDSIIARQAFNEPIQFKFGYTPPSAYHFIEKLKAQGVNLNHHKTTLNLYLQNKIQELLKENVLKNKSLGDAGAILVVDNPTGEVLVYVGSPDYFNNKHGMLDAVHSLRSPGSALKPFVYANALEKNWNLSSVIADLPIKIKVASGVLSPSNYGRNFSGPQQIRYALANSKNIPALLITAKLGEASVLDFLRHVGFESLSQSARHYGVGVSLGNGEVSLWELVQSYSMLARGGVLKPLRMSLDNQKTESRRVISRETAFLISNVLSDPQARADEFGRYGSLEFDFDLAAKTGTSSQYRDHWVVGYTTKYTVGLWKGNANGKPLRSVSASIAVGDLFKQIFNELHRQQLPHAFSKPEKIIQKRVCSLSGNLAGRYCQGSRLEYFAENKEPQHVCEFHKTKVVNHCNGSSKTVTYVEMPKEYEPWLKVNNLPTLEKVLKEKCGGIEKTEMRLSSKQPEILEPISDTALAYDPRIPAEHQKLRLQLTNTEQKEEIYLLVNGKPYRKINNLLYTDWPIQKGKVVFELQVGEKILADSVKVNIF